jgi:hypothetical protein
LELVQAALHRHKYTYFSDYNCDAVQLLLCLYPGNLKKNLIDANKGSILNWSEFKNEADVIVSTLREAGQSLYDVLPTGKSVPSFNPVVPPLTPFLKSGPTVPTTSSPAKLPLHKAASVTSTVTLAGVPIADAYKTIPALKIYEGKQHYACFNCKVDTPSRHYYLQCQQLCMFSTCTNMNSAPHWGNSCPLIAQHLSNKALAVSKRVTKEQWLLNSPSLPMTYIAPTIQGYNAWPYDAGKSCTSDNTAILDWC